MEAAVGAVHLAPMQTDRTPSVSPLLLLAVVVLVGSNLRPFLAGVGPLAARIVETTGLDYQAISLLTLVPMVLMGIFAFLGPSVQQLIGARPAMIAALLVLCLGCALRLFASNGTALIGTAALCGLGVALVQAVFPGMIKQHFPGHVAIVMGLYSAMLMAGGALGAQLSPVVADIFASWRIGLAWWAAPALVAALLVMVVMPRGVAQPRNGIRSLQLLRRPRTWLLMACFGLVNGGYSSVVAWLAPYYQSIGWSAAASGSLLAVMAACQAIAALSIPALAARSLDRRLWIWLTLLLQVAGFVGLALWPQLSPLGWMLVVGAGLGGSFALSMVVTLDHLAHPADAGALAALMQGGGFIIAALPPWIVAALHDLTGSFAAGWLMHAGCAAVVAGLSFRFTPRGYAKSMGLVA